MSHLCLKFIIIQVLFVFNMMYPFWLQDTSLTLDKQIKFFHRTIKHNLPKTFTENEELEKHISESLFFVSTGVNDYFHNGTFRGNKSFAFFLLREITLRIKVNISCVTEFTTKLLKRLSLIAFFHNFSGKNEHVRI